MSQVARSRIIRIGNSQGVRIPKSLLEQSGLTEEVQLLVGKGEIVIRSARRVRENWAEELTEMAGAGADTLLDPELPDGFDEQEWDW